jgi:hypothetical protein
MFVETLNAISTSVTALDLVYKTAPTFIRIFKLFKDGDLKVAILGANGTGKSTLGRVLSGGWERNKLLQPYQESISIERYSLDSDAVGSVIVVPGQERLYDSWDNLLRDIIQGKVDLIINVVAWGYHSFSFSSYRDFPFYRSGMTTQDFLEIYLQERRIKEQKALEKIVGSLLLTEITNQKKKKLFLVTLVTKQDLWWNERLQVQTYYEKGEYESQIQLIRNKLGSANFVHEYCSAALVMENLVSGTGELLATTTGGYDDRLKFANLQALLKIIESFCEIKMRTKEV